MSLGSLPRPWFPVAFAPLTFAPVAFASGAAARRAPSVPVGDFRVEARRPWFPWRTP